MEASAINAYEAALEGCGFYLHPEPGLLRFEGQDRIDFLQRQTTNDLSSLAADRVLRTILTSPTARILDILSTFDGRAFLESGEDVLAALTLPGHGSRTETFLKGKIFFMDKVTLDLVTDLVAIELTGPGAGGVLEACGLEIPVNQGGITLGRLAGAQALLSAGDALGTASLQLTVLDANPAGMISQLLDQGARQLSEPEYKLLQVENGQPGVDRELTQDFTPLEIGLEAAISSTKGCYTGQEVIARQLTYDKVTRRLTGLRSQEAIVEGQNLWQEGKSVGVVTSAVDSPRFGHIGLGVVKRPNHKPGTQLMTDKNGQGSIETVSPPFSV